MIKTKMILSLPTFSSVVSYYSTPSRFKLTTEKEEVESIKGKQPGSIDDTGRKREAAVPQRNLAALSSVRLDIMTTNTDP